MASTTTRIGLNCALSTPFDGQGRVDPVRLVAHAQRVMRNGCDGFTLFGTTGEGSSLSLGERYLMLGAVAGAGINMGKEVIAGVSAATIDDAVAQARAAYEADCRALLVAPPFYFANASDDGLFRFFAAMFDRLGADLRDIILYHIPGMTRNALSIELTQRLMTAFPGALIGVKDSNGDWAASQRRLKELNGLQILIGDERQIARAVQQGGGGTICGLANLAPDLLRPLVHQGVEDQRVNAMVEAICEHSFMSAVKAMIAAETGDPNWRTMRAPLDALGEVESTTLAARLAAIRAGHVKAA